MAAYAAPSRVNPQIPEHTKILSSLKFSLWTKEPFRVWCFVLIWISQTQLLRSNTEQVQHNTCLDHFKFIVMKMNQKYFFFRMYRIYLNRYNQIYRSYYIYFYIKANVYIVALVRTLFYNKFSWRETTIFSTWELPILIEDNNRLY